MTKANPPVKHRPMKKSMLVPQALLFPFRGLAGAGGLEVETEAR